MMKALLGARARLAHDELRRLSPVAQFYVLATIVLGGIALLFEVATARFTHPALFLALLAIGVATSVVKISVPLVRSRSSLSLSFAVTLAAIPALGGPEACLIGMASAWSQCSFRMKARNPLYRTLFSVVVVGLSVRVAAQVFQWGRADDAHYVIAVTRPVALATTGYLLVNSLFVATAIALATGERVTKICLNTLLWSAPTYFVAGGVAALAIAASDTGTYGWAFVLVVPLYLTYRSSRHFVDSLEEEREEVRRVSELQLATIEALALAVETKDRTSHDHVRQIQRYAEALARAVNMPEPQITGVKTAALLHDIGHLAVPEHILTKPGALSRDEFQRVKIHPAVGADILRSVPFPYPVASLILSHHERWDGTGYPSGLRGEDIPLGARVLAVVDFFTALHSDRPYRPARTRDEAVALLREESGAAFDPRIVDEFLALLPSLDVEHAPVSHAGAVTRATEVQAPTPGRALEQIRVAHREARVLHEIAEALVTSLTVDSVMAVLSSKLPELLPYSCGALFLRDAERASFRCRWAEGVGEDWARQLTGTDVAAIDGRLPPVRTGIPLRSTLASPLMSGGQAIGVFAIYAGQPGVYADDDRRLLDRVCQQAAAATANALVFEQMHEASLTDPITGLANRRAIHERLQLHFDAEAAERGTFSLLLLDVNDLKRLNDDYGHQVGDRALQQIGAALASFERDTDLCARYGGDEFVVLLWGCTAGVAEGRRKELQRAIAALKLFVRHDVTVDLSVSAGVATFPDDADSAATLLSVADQRMYADKARQRSRASHDLLNRPGPARAIAI